jgi:hypothetical protein
MLNDVPFAGIAASDLEVAQSWSCAVLAGTTELAFDTSLRIAHAGRPVWAGV